MLDFVKNAKWIIVAAVVGLLIGFASGWYEKSLRVDAQEKEALEEVREADLQAVENMRQAESTLIDKQDATEQRFNVINREVIKYVPKTVYIEREVKTDSTSRIPLANSDCVSPTLSVYAVELLNAARENRDFDATAIGDEKGQASTEIGLQEIVQSDLDVTERYHELATNHDALVDYVQSLIDTQKQQLNK